LLTTGCSWLTGPTFIVPDEATAREQMEVAQRQLSDARQTFDEELRKEEIRKAIAACQKVVDRFPNDRRFTPVAHLFVASLYQELGEHRRAERVYRQVLKLYPEDAEVNSGALFGLAETLEKLGKAEESKETYRELVDLYGQSNQRTIRERVEVARLRYRSVSVR
jgi:tetratricopeptide (TPR) repeat protein